jgi:hypothetical protein
MPLDISKIKSKLTSLSSTNTKSASLWKPAPGKQVIRIVPYVHQPDNPFIELYFHYNFNNKSYLSPTSFGRPDPIVEFSDKLKSTGDKDEWRMGKKLEPKMRTYVPIIVRGEESEGVKFWGFGKQVYQELLSIIADPDYGDITEYKTGRDITVEFKSAEEAGKNFPETLIRIKPNVSSVTHDKKIFELLNNQKDILEIFVEPSYDDLKKVLEKYLSEDNSSTEEETETVNTSETTIEEDVPVSVAKTSKKTSKSSDIESQFDDLFNS